MDYKKYSLENLENWLHDSMSCAEATPQEIYDVIVGVVKENYYCYKQQTSQAYELLALLNGNDKELYDAVMKEREYYESSVTSCDKDDPSPECKDAWNDFWEQSYLSGVTDTPEEAEELRAEIEAIRKAGGYEYTPLSTKQDKVIKWQLPVSEIAGNYFVTFPDDLLDAASLKEGDTVEWVDNNDGSYTLRKV